MIPYYLFLLLFLENPLLILTNLLWVCLGGEWSVSQLAKNLKFGRDVKNHQTPIIL